MNRRELLERAAAAGVLLLLPAPLRRLVDAQQPVQSAVAELPEPELVTIVVKRGRGGGTMARLTRVTPEFLEDGAADPVGFLERDAVQSFLELQRQSPGRATDPVRLRGRYRLQVQRDELAEWRDARHVERWDPGVYRGRLVAAA